MVSALAAGMVSVVPRPRVLVAEDDTEMRWLVAHALRRDGYDVVEARNGDELYRELSMRFVRFGDPNLDLIVTDVRMPGRSGLDVVELLRKLATDIPLIVMTAFGDDEVRTRAGAAGAVLLDKPFDLADLRAAAALLTLAVR